MAIIKIIRLAGCIVLKIPLTSQYLRLIKALIGKKASMPGGLVIVGKIPLSSWFTKKVNFTPVGTAGNGKIKDIVNVKIEINRNLPKWHKILAWFDGIE